MTGQTAGNFHYYIRWVKESKWYAVGRRTISIPATIKYAKLLHANQNIYLTTSSI